MSSSCPRGGARRSGRARDERLFRRPRIESPVMRRTLVVGLALAGVFTAFAPRAAAAPRPTYTTGDSWTYRRNLTGGVHLKFSGDTTLEAGPGAPVSTDGMRTGARAA